MKSVEDDVRVVATRDTIEDVLWAYAGEKSFQRKASVTGFFNTMKLVARYPRDNRPVKDGEIAVFMPRSDAEALAYNKEPDLVARALERLNEAL